MLISNTHRITPLTHNYTPHTHLHFTHTHTHTHTTFRQSEQSDCSSQIRAIRPYQLDQGRVVKPEQSNQNNHLIIIRPEKWVQIEPRGRQVHAESRLPYAPLKRRALIGQALRGASHRVSAVCVCVCVCVFHPLHRPSQLTSQRVRSSEYHSVSQRQEKVVYQRKDAQELSVPSLVMIHCT